MNESTAKVVKNINERFSDNTVRRYYLELEVFAKLYGVKQSEIPACIEVLNPKLTNHTLSIGQQDSEDTDDNPKVGEFVIIDQNLPKKGPDKIPYMVVQCRF
jgi:uncharacterized Zn finger protein